MYLYASGGSPDKFVLTSFLVKFTRKDECFFTIKAYKYNKFAFHWVPLDVKSRIAYSPKVFIIFHSINPEC